MDEAYVLLAFALTTERAATSTEGLTTDLIGAEELRGSQTAIISMRSN